MVKKTVRWYRPVEKHPRRDQQEVLFVPYCDGMMYQGIYNLRDKTFGLSNDRYYTFSHDAVAYWTPYPLTSPMRKEKQQ